MKYKLIIFDIDGTITKHVSSWRYIHEKLDLWDVLACKYQEQFLAGRISYKKFCELDAAHWKGLSEKKIKAVFNKVPYAKNVPWCIKNLKKAGFKIAAVSTGLQYIARRCKKELKFDHVLSNQLIVRKGVLTGGVKINISHGQKGRAARRIIKQFGVTKHQVISVGDTAGDIPLARNSGYSIAFNSADKEFLKIVDYQARTKDFKEIYNKIIALLK